MRNLKSELAAGEVILGVWIVVPWIEAVEIAGYAGYDTILINTEHGAIDTAQAQAMVAAARGVGMAPVWRVSGVSRGEIKRALDWGAAGIFVPEIKTAEEAALVVDAAMYPPLGHRGVDPYRPVRFGLDDTTAYIQRANDEVAVCLNIELKEAIDNIEEIVQVEGIDVINIGPDDLSTSLAIPFQMDHPDMLDAIDRVLAAALPRNLVVGLSGGTPEHIRKWMARGMRFFESAGVAVTLSTTMRRHVAELRTAIEQ